MKPEEVISVGAVSSVKAICDLLAPSCIGCPHAKLVSSVDLHMERDATRIQLSARCDYIGRSGEFCPDGGMPGETYLNVMGVTRSLGESQVRHVYSISRHEIEHRKVKQGTDSSAYQVIISGTFKEEKFKSDELLHILHETISFVEAGETWADDGPMVWKGPTAFVTQKEAQAEYITKHIRPYQLDMDHMTRICEPTSYMKANFPKEHIRDFGIFVEFDEKAAKQVRMMPPMQAADGPQDTIREPDLVVPQEELYEDWGSFG